MRLARRAAAVLVLVAVFAAAPAAQTQDKRRDHPASLDLLSRGSRVTGKGDWSSWWAVNRAAIVKPNFRASAPAAGAPPLDVAARARAREALIRELTSKEELIASEAALALGRAGDARDIPRLAALVDPENAVHARRMHILAAIGLGLLPAADADQAAEARRVLLAGIASARGEHDRYAYFWASCAYALELRGDIASVPRLVDLSHEARAGDPRTAIHGEVLGAMVHALASLAGAEAVPEIEAQASRRKLLGGGTTDVAWAGCHAATRIPGDATKKFMRAAAKDDREVVRRVALAALGAVSGPDDATAAILCDALINDPDDLCRQAAAIGLGRLGHATSSKTLISALEYEGSGRSALAQNMLKDRGAIAFALGLCARAKPEARIGQALERALANSRSQDDQAALVVACGLAGVLTTRTRIGDLADEGKGGILAPLAASALALTGAGPAERKALHEAVAQSQFADIRGEAALTLGALRDHTVVDELRAIVSSKRTKDLDRSTAAVCLGRVGDDADIDLMIEAIHDAGEDGQVRACLVHGLGRLLDRTENAGLGRIVADSKWFHGAVEDDPDPIFDLQRLAE